MLHVSAQEGASRDVTPEGMTVGATKWSADGSLLARRWPVDGRASAWSWWNLEDGTAEVNVAAATTSRPCHGESASRPVTPPSSTATRIQGVIPGSTCSYFATRRRSARSCGRPRARAATQRGYSR